MTEAEVKKLTTVITGAYPGAHATKDTDRVYWRMLIDLDYVVANAAVEKLLATRSFMPSVAEIREACLALTAGERTKGGEAWGAVLKAIGRYGGNRTPGVDFHFADSVTAKCVRALSWRELCQSESQVADRARFIELYDQLAADHRKQQLSGSLPAMQRFLEHQRKQLEARHETTLAAGDAIAKVLDHATAAVDLDGDNHDT